MNEKTMGFKLGLTCVGSLLFLSLVGGCGSDPVPGAVCTAGWSVACDCFDGRAGAQVCNSSGSGYGTCECGGLTDGGPILLCAPGSSQSCACSSGPASTQTCYSDGSGYGACGCATGGCTPACGPAFVCASGVCTIDPASRWNVVLENLTVPSLGCSGIGWDSTFSATPDEADPAVTISVGSTTSATSGAGSDTSYVSWSGGPTVTNVRADDLATYLGFDVQDVDASSNDEIGNCFVPSTLVVGAFDGTTQTTNCSANCTSASVAGWGPLHWHLERY